MAINYDSWKKTYSGLNDDQKKKYNDNMQQQWGDVAKLNQEYMDRYNQEMEASKPVSTEQSVSNQWKLEWYGDTKNKETWNQIEWQNYSNLTNEKQSNWGWESMRYDDWKKEYDKLDDKSKKEYSNFLDTQADDYWGRWFLDTYKQEQIANANPDLNTEKFWPSNWEISVKEWTAAQTWMPDYQLNSDARLKEIASNLNAYWATNPEFFKDRNTFNQIFHYGERDEQQKALLDVYWKKKEDMDNASKYNTWDSIAAGMKDADITTDQLNYIKEYSPEAYREWQQKQQDEINLRIANLATPADPTDNAELFNSLLTKLWLDPGDPYQIYDNWYSMCERLWVFSDSDKLKSYQSQLDANHSKMESIMSRYSASTWGTVSDALAAARMSKALAPYQQREVDLQNSYTTLLNWRNSNLAVANQSAQVLAMQAAEDQRIWNQRLQGLGFAMSTASFRTPEQQAQLQLQTAQIQNDMNLLNQAKANDLSLYNQYASTKLQNQLQSELTDLSVSDPAQLRANLNNVLSSYYSQWGDIIERSQSQVVDDVLAYAKEKWISVAEALKENFIKPLQNKTEYKNAMANKYAAPSSSTVWYSKITINGKDYLVQWDRIVDPASLWIWSGWESWGWKAKPYNVVSSTVMESWLDTFVASHEVGTKWWQCGKFVNDYLVSIWVTDERHRYYDNDLSTKLNSRNSQTAAVWSIAIFDYNHLSDDWINHGHVAIVTKVNSDWSFEVIESNYPSWEKIGTRRVEAGDPACKWFFNPSLWESSTQGYNAQDPYSWISWYTAWGIAINNWGWIDSLESVYSRSWANATEMKDVLADYWLSQVEYNEQKERYMNYVETNEMVKSILEVKEKAEKLKAWAQEESNKWLKNSEREINIANQWYANWWQDLWTADKTIENIQQWKALFDNLMSNAGFQKYLDMKANGAQFWIMTDSEWRKVDSSVAPISWEQWDTIFMENLNSMITWYDQVLAKLGYDAEEWAKPERAEDIKITPNNWTGVNSSVIQRTVNGRIEYSVDWGKTRY